MRSTWINGGTPNKSCPKLKNQLCASSAVLGVSAVDLGVTEGQRRDAENAEGVQRVELGHQPAK
jgi:hypothetical protein